MCASKHQDARRGKTITPVGFASFLFLTWKLASQKRNCKTSKSFSDAPFVLHYPISLTVSIFEELHSEKRKGFITRGIYVNDRMRPLLWIRSRPSQIYFVWCNEDYSKHRWREMKDARHKLKRKSLILRNYEAVRWQRSVMLEVQMWSRIINASCWRYLVLIFL